MWKRIGVVALLVLGGCGGDDEPSCAVDDTYHPTIDPAQFSTTIDNPLFPLVPGTVTVFDGGGEHVEVTVTADTKVIAGVTTVVVRDTVTVEGDIAEDTFDWYAQDSDGNVWYFGEDTKELDHGTVTSTEGSWETGVDGAQPGIVMRAAPAIGNTYRQEYKVCEAEDEADVVGTAADVTVPAGSYTGCLETHEFTRLEPDVDEHKFYCAGVGLVLELDIPTGDRVELTSITPPA